MRFLHLGFSFALALCLNASAVAEPISLNIEGGRAGLSIHLSALSVSGASWSATSVLDGKQQIQMNLDLGERWTVVANAEGFWAAPIEISTNTSTLKIWPATKVRLLLVPQVGSEMPREVEVRLTASTAASPRSSQAEQPPEAKLVCQPGAKGAAECSGPFGNWDIRVKAQGHVPAYFWNRTLAGSDLDLGRIQLRKGVAILGRVVAEDSPADARSAVVQAKPFAPADAGSVGSATSLAKLVASAKVNEWGYFAFDGLPPGAYELSATQPGYQAASTVVLLKAEEDLELTEALSLQRPARAVIRIDPVSDPAGGAWKVVLRRIRPEGATDVAEGSADDGGEWRSPFISQGQYSVWVENRNNDQMAKADFELLSGSQTVEVDLSLLEVEGKVRLGERALEGDVWFGGRYGDVRVHAASDDEGLFSVVLPHAGTWSVDVFGGPTMVAAAGVTVEVQQPKPGNPARVEINLPDTEVRGSVHDANGNGVEGAIVLLVPVGGSARAVSSESDVLGNFSIRGQAPGSYSVEARKEHAVSERAQVVLQEDLTPPDLNLVIRPRSSLKGRVASWSGPVAGAWILAFPMTSNGTLAVMMAPQARSGLDGEFEMELPPDTVNVRLITTALGYTLSATTVPLASRDQSASISLDQNEGTLELARPEPGSGKIPFILANGQPIDLPYLELWARAHTPNPSNEISLVIQGMPAGSYAYCSLTPDEAMLVFGGAASPGARACTEGQLGAGGSLRLGRP